MELSTGIPMLYIFKEGSFIRRGSPVAPTEAGVYAYTKVCNFFSAILDKIQSVINANDLNSLTSLKRSSLRCCSFLCNILVILLFL